MWLNLLPSQTQYSFSTQATSVIYNVHVANLTWDSIELRPVQIN